MSVRSSSPIFSGRTAQRRLPRNTVGEQEKKHERHHPCGYLSSGIDFTDPDLIERGMPGFSIGQKIDKVGMRGSPTAELVFDDCFVAEDQIMGPLGGGVGVLMSGLDYERVVLAGLQLGIMQACLDVVVPYVRDRRQFRASKAGYSTRLTVAPRSRETTTVLLDRFTTASGTRLVDARNVGLVLLSRNRRNRADEFYVMRAWLE